MKENHGEKTIVFFSRDPAGVQAIIPVIQRCRQESVARASVVSAPVSRFLYERSDIPSYVVTNNVSDEFQRSFEELFERECPLLVVTGTSVRHPGDELTPEQWLVSHAKARCIPTLSILDFWGRYYDRFSLDGRTFESQIIPDYLCVLDQRCIHDLKQLGVAKGALHVTHNPFFDDVVRRRTERDSKRPAELLDGQWNILFASQPLREFGGRPRYSQFTLFEMLCDELIARSSNQQAHILVWVHPKESMEGWKQYDGKYQGISVQVTTKPVQSERIFPYITFLATSHSSVVYEALYFDTPCVSLLLEEPSDKEELITNDIGLSWPVRSRSELQRLLATTDFSALREGLNEKREALSRQGLFFSDGKATDRVMSIVCGVLN